MPGTWLANGSPWATAAKAVLTPHQHQCQDRLFRPNCTTLVLAGYTSPSGHPHSCGTAGHGMAWHMARGQQSSRHTAQPGQMDVEKGKAGCPILCQPGPDLHQGQQPPGQSCPKGCVGMGPRRGLKDKDGSWHRGPATQPVSRRFRSVPVSCCHSDPVASVGHLEIHPPLPPLALQVAVCP